jgi:hypothetical protein
MIKKSLLRGLPVLFVPAFLLLSACGNTNHAPDVSNVKVKLQTYRFDKDLYAIDTNHIGAGLSQLSAKYPDFLNFYLDTILAYDIHGNYNDTVKGIRDGLRIFLTYKDYVDLEDTIKQHFHDTKKEEEGLMSAFQYMKHYFPEYHVPKVLFVDLNLNKLPAFTIDTSILGICLDMFLGPQFPYYRSVGVPDYMAPHLRPDFIPVAAFNVIYNSRYPFITDDRTMLDLIIQRGKQQYFLHQIFPHLPDSVLFAFSQRQTNWCNDNEALIYNFFTPNLYNKEPNVIMPYVNDGPFAQGLEPVTEPVKSTPANIGSFLGYKIVSSYMANHPKVSLSDLLEREKDPQKIFSQAEYRPKDKK